MTTRQLICCYLIYSTSIKCLTLPSVLARGFNNWAWLVALGGVFWELLGVIIATLILRWHPRGLLSLPVLLMGTWVTLTQIWTLAKNDLATNCNPWVFALTLIILVLFFMRQRPVAFFRAAEVLWLLWGLALLVAVVPILYSLPQANFNNLFNGTAPTWFPTLSRCSLFFEGFTFVVVFGEQIPKRHRLLKTSLTAAGTGVIFVGIMMLGTVLFGNLWALKPMGLIELTAAGAFLTTHGSLDWLLALALMAALILRLGLQTVAAYRIVKRRLPDA